MGGSANRKNEPLVINSTNVFAALGTLRKKKKSKFDKEQGSSKSKSSASQEKQEKVEPEPQVIWAPAKLTSKSWADIEDDDDDDYYATTAPPQSTWSVAQDSQPKTKDSWTPAEETDSEEDGDEIDDENEKEHVLDKDEVPVVKEPAIEKPAEVITPRECEKQLSKKALKKKELAELDAVLAELGYPKSESSGHDDSHGTAREKKVENPNGDVEKENVSAGESKSTKKKKKKDKTLKDGNERQNQDSRAQAENGTDKTTGTVEAEDLSTARVKEKMKKVASVKKKKSSKEIDSAARAAASEAAARSAKLAAAKKKEKNHYNQQPAR